MRFFALVAFFAVAYAQIKVACVGDSITAGAGSSNAGQTSYPPVLQKQLGSGYNVTNYGVSGTTMMTTGDNPYWNTQSYKNAIASNPQIVLIMLGTNDAKTYQWNQTQYTNDYNTMIQNFKNLASKPTVYAMIPVPLYKDGVFFHESNSH